MGDNGPIKSVSVKADCPACGKVTEFSENVTETVNFKCTGCDTEKKAEIPPTRNAAKTTNYCGNCERETEWHEAGWEQIEVT